MRTYFDLVLTFLFPISILGFINILKIYMDYKVIKLHKNTYLLSLIPIGVELILISVFILPEVLRKQLSINTIGPFISIGIYFIYGILISLTYLFVIMSITKKSFKIFFIFLYSGLFVMMLNIHNMLRDLSDLSNFQQEFIRCIYPIPFGILLTSVVSLFMKRLMQPSKAGE